MAPASATSYWNWRDPMTQASCVPGWHTKRSMCWRTERLELLPLPLLPRGRGEHSGRQVPSLPKSRPDCHRAGSVADSDDEGAALEHEAVHVENGDPVGVGQLHK